MTFARMARRIAPIAALAAATALSGCGDMEISINDQEGVPLSELDLSGDAPTGLVIAGADMLVVTEGDEFTIDVEGDEADQLRFILEDGTFAVMRSSDDWENSGSATVNVTMPAPDNLVIAGSGSASLFSMSGNPEIVIAGSGSAEIDAMDVDSLEITMPGSGSVSASGSADNLELTVLGTGSANMDDLQVETAEITIAGSGSASFSSDGSVEANIAGSGSVRVYGSADCEENSMGSGSLVCSEREDVVETEEAVSEDA